MPHPADRHPTEPADAAEYTAANDRLYSLFAPAYDSMVRLWPTWRRWISTALPLIDGPRVLEVSFGTGHLLTRCARRHETFGIDLNPRLVHIAARNLRRAGVRAHVQRARVERLPYRSGCFDTVVSTMAFSGYPDGKAAMSELARVLRPGGRLVLIDVNIPHRPSLLGRIASRVWILGGDILRDMSSLFEIHGLSFSDTEIGGFGTVHLYEGRKRA